MYFPDCLHVPRSCRPLKVDHDALRLVEEARRILDNVLDHGFRVLLVELVLLRRANPHDVEGREHPAPTAGLLRGRLVLIQLVRSATTSAPNTSLLISAILSSSPQ